MTIEMERANRIGGNTEETFTRAPRVSGNIVWGSTDEHDNIFTVRRPEPAVPEIMWRGEQISQELYNELQEIRVQDIAEDPHPGHSRDGTVDQMARARAALAGRSMTDVLQAAGMPAEDVAEAGRTMSRIGGFVIERPQTVRETVESLGVVHNFENEENFNGQPDHVSQIEELERERYEAREIQWHGTFPDRVRAAMGASRDFLTDVIIYAAKPYMDHRAKIAEEARLDALPNAWRNPRRNVRV